MNVAGLMANDKSTDINCIVSRLVNKTSLHTDW